MITSLFVISKSLVGDGALNSAQGTLGVITSLFVISNLLGDDGTLNSAQGTLGMITSLFAKFKSLGDALKSSQGTVDLMFHFCINQVHGVMHLIQHKTEYLH